METIAFYSYKGGVGRSLLVANTARYLGMLGKRVVAMDFDIEAPGLHYKLGRTVDPAARPAIHGGTVPYLLATAKGAKNPPRLADHIIQLALPEGSGGSLSVMPAGPAPSREYWTALKQLRERLRFDDPSGKGLAALLDLHARIEDELKPDYLLIDARTGVTELGGLTTTALADCVVCLLVPNQESIDGTLAIVEALKAAPPTEGRAAVRVVPVLTRVMGDMATEGHTADTIKRLVSIASGTPRISQKVEPKTFILPHDSSLGAADHNVGGEQKPSSLSPLHKAYLELFQHLFPQTQVEAGEALRRLEAVVEL
jgi:CobQ/CobB/MinD/ParA nucleotide binding domain